MTLGKRRGWIRGHGGGEDWDEDVFPFEGKEELEEGEYTGGEAAGGGGGHDDAAFHEQTCAGVSGGIGRTRGVIMTITFCSCSRHHLVSQI